MSYWKVRVVLDEDMKEWGSRDTVVKDKWVPTTLRCTCVVSTTVGVGNGNERATARPKAVPSKGVETISKRVYSSRVSPEISWIREVSTSGRLRP